MKKWVDKKKEWLYKKALGRFILNLFIKRNFMSKFAGKFADSTISRKILSTFIKDYNINLDNFIVPSSGFKTLNQLFTRDYRKNKIKFLKDKGLLCAPAEGFTSILKDINYKSIVQAKGFNYSLKELFGDEKENTAQIFDKGILIRIRLTPKEYHWFHYLDDAEILEMRKIKGFSYTAEHLALENIKKMFCKNVRDITILETENFGKVAYVEIGSTFVSSIVQLNKQKDKVRKGDKKGCFKFGGRTNTTFFLLIDTDNVKCAILLSISFTGPDINILPSISIKDILNSVTIL
jgi:phosphatidylserine decarboxylase